MKLQRQFIYLCCCASLLYFICFYSHIFRKAENHRNEIHTTVELTTPRNVHSKFWNVKSPKRSYNKNISIEFKEKNEECLSFVSTSCDNEARSTKFQKLPEKFAKVNF